MSPSPVLTLYLEAVYVPEYHHVWTKDCNCLRKPAPGHSWYLEQAWLVFESSLQSGEISRVPRG